MPVPLSAAPPLDQLEQTLRAACSELGKRLRAGEVCSAEEYLTKHPELSTKPDLAIELIYTEYVVRSELQQSVSHEDLLTRFPQWRSDLEQLIEVHQQILGDTPAGSTVVPEQRKTSATQGGVPIASANVVSSGRRVGNYELGAEIGRGGMGVVYRARQVGLNRHVALKMILSGDFASPRELLQFQREAEAAARLHHPNIVPIYEVGTHDGQPYLSMELIDGGRLDDFLTLSPLPPRSAAELLSRMARAAHYAHQRGVVHRDLKPSNILLAPSDRENGIALGSTDSDAAFYEPKFADFGLAKSLVDGDAQHTLSGTVVGTPNYMSPEQALGKSGEIGPATDVYSLGAILYESLTGQPPFLGRTPIETVQQVIADEPVAPLRLRPKLPRDLATICMKCLEKVPGKRYTSALELSDDLRRFLEGEPIRAKAVSPSEWIAKWARRHPAIAALATTLVTVTVIGFATVFALWRQAESDRGLAVDEKSKAERARQSAESARDYANQARAAAERSLYFRRIAQAHAEWEAFQVGQAERVLDECPESMRNWEWSYLKALCHTELRTLTGHTDYVSCVAYSPDGKLVASGSGRWASGRSGEVIVWDAATGETRAVLREQSGQIASVAFSPDSQRIAACSRRWNNPEPSSLKVWNIAGEVLWSVDTDDWDVAFSPDGTQLVAGGMDGFIRLRNADSGELLREFVGHSQSDWKNVFEVAFSPDGKQIATTGRDGYCRLYSCETGEELLAIFGDGDSRRMSFSPDGCYLAFSNYGDALFIQNLATPETKPTLHRFYNGRITAFAYSPEGRRMAVASVDGSVRIISFAEARTAATEQKRLRVHDGNIVDLAFSPDGRTLATGGIDRLVKLSDVQADFPSEELQFANVGMFHRLAFSPDSSKLFLPSGYNFGSPGRGMRSLNTLNINELTAGKPMRGHAAWLTDVAVSPDGSRVATSGEDKSVRIWDPTTGRELRKLFGHAAGVTSVAFNAEGTHLATGCADGSIRVWDSATGESLRELSGHEGAVTMVRYNPVSPWLASSGMDGTVRFWSVTSDDHRPPLRGHAGTINSLAFSHNGKWLATAGEDETARIWDADSGQVLQVLHGHYGPVNTVCFNATDQRLASSSDDWTVKLWDVKSGELALTLRSKDITMGLAFSPDGQRLVAARGANVRIWNSKPQPTPPRLPVDFDNANRAWHEREAKRCESDKQYFAAAFHVGGLIRQQPDEPLLYFHRGNALAEIGEWEKASADFQKMHELSKNNVAIVLLAHAKLALGQDREYRTLCQQLLDTVNDSTPLGTANDYLWYKLLVPIESAEAARLVELTERVLAAANDNERLSRTNTHAAALYRAGRYEEAHTWLQKLVEPQSTGGTIEVWLYLALTEHQLGHAVEARQWLEKSTTWLGDPPENYPNGVSVPTNFMFPVEWNTLRREAEAAINAPMPATP